jgi:hypothetical protein
VVDLVDLHSDGKTDLTGFPAAPNTMGSTIMGTSAVDKHYLIPNKDLRRHSAK